MKKIIGITIMSMILSFSSSVMPTKAADSIGVKEITTVSADDLPEGPNLPEGPSYIYLSEHSGQEVKVRIQQDGIFYILILGEKKEIYY